MRIALITDGISPYVLGGMQKHSFYLAKYFAKNKIYIDLIHFNDSSIDIEKLEIFSSEEKRFINSIVLQFPTTLKFPGHYIFKSYLYSCQAFLAIKGNLKNYDFIYTKGFTGWKLISEKKKGNVSCCNIGVNFHGYEMFQIAPDFKSKMGQFLLRPFVKTITRQADVVFSYGEKITEIITSLGVNKSRIVEIPSGVERNFISSSIFPKNNFPTKFVFLGRAERRKGIIELNEVLKSLILENQPFSFEFIGPIVDSMKIHHESVIYHNEIRDTEKIKQILVNSDVLVCPSWSEGFPNVILEAMASGLAIIATNVGAVGAMVSEKNGWIIRPGNKPDLKHALLQAIHPKELATKKENSLKLIQSQFNWDVIADLTIKSIKSFSA
jgi:glycosyltransferase involved in cell wall biosynthesis